MAARVSLTRRDFLKLGGASLVGLAAAPYTGLQAAAPSSGLQAAAPSSGLQALTPDQQGRVAYERISVYQRPSFEAPVVKQYWRDTVLPIKEATIGDEEPAHNRVWYQVGEQAYAHSGGIQPVRTIVQPPISDIPENGQVAEVSVPFTDAHWEMYHHLEFAWRLYYQTTHWVIGLTYGHDGTPWYRLLDDKWNLEFYALARHFRLIPPEELDPISPQVPASAKRLEVRTKDQIVIAFEDGRPVFMARAATGAEFSNGKFFTPSGRHHVHHKMPSRHMAAGNLAYNGYDLPGIPWVSYITENGVAFHGTYWHNDYGRPRSHGCINLTPQAAKWIYRWTDPVVPAVKKRVYQPNGTRVDVL
jgi:hypothetical protein